MDSSKKFTNPNPSLNANVLSKLVFWWLKPLFWYGRNNDLEVKDLYNALPRDHSEPLGNCLERHWLQEVKDAHEAGRKPKLFTAIRRTFLWSFLYYGLWILFLSTVLRVLQPYTLGLLIWHFDPRAESTVQEAYMYASGVVVMAILIACINHHSFLGQLVIGMRVRVACSSLVYRKILRLSRSAAEKTAGGQIINLLSNDVSKFDRAFMMLHYIWVMPIQGALIGYLMWRSVGIAAIAGLFLITIQTIPVQGYLSRWTARLRLKTAIRTDERVRLMSEIIGGIQVIKMYTWEKPFEKLVSLARSYELDVLTVTSYLRGFNLSTFVFTERTTLYFTIMAFVLLGNTISADKVFSLAQYFNILQATMAIFYPIALTLGAEALISIKRLENFLLLEESESNIRQPPSNEKIGISIKDATASWIENSIVNTLHQINVHVQPGQLCGLVGPVGAGKSSLLQLILGELRTSHGQVYVGGNVSFASQEPWLFAGTVRNNILFGQPYNSKRYREVTKVCALIKDFEQLPQGDKTIIGDRGTALSGGQRARINLARAVYRDADVYLLDDPLSAVDTHVGKHLFEECINGYLSKKTRVLVTHQVQYLKDVDLIVVLNNGQVENQGTFEEFQKNRFDLHHILVAEESEEIPPFPEHAPRSRLHSESSYVSNSAVDEDDEEREEPQETEELMAKGDMSKSIYWKYISAGSSPLLLFFVIFCMIFGQFSSNGTDYWVAYWAKQEESRVMEMARRGINDSADNSSIMSSTDSSILTTIPSILSWNDFESDTFSNDTITNLPNLQNSTDTTTNVTELITTVSTVIANMSSAPEKVTDIISTLPTLLAEATSTSLMEILPSSAKLTTINSTAEIPISIADDSRYLDIDTMLWIYGAFICGSVVLITIRNILCYKICMTASKVLHNNMFSSILKAPMRFFDTHPSGRILNRFSKDVGAVDEFLPMTLLDSIQIFSVMTGILIQVLIINWWTVFPMAIMGILYWKIRTLFLCTAQDIKRLEGATKSPVFSHVNSSLMGLAVIRSSGAQEMVRKEFDVHQDGHTSAYYLTLATSAAFGFWLDAVSIAFVAFITYSFILFDNGNTFAGNVGLAISQVLILCGMLQHGMRQTAETVTQMTSVERILQFTTLEKEGSFDSEPGQKPPSYWPAKGQIKFDHVYLRYSETDPPVLKDLNFIVQPAMKVGIVGRTGAGKSSLISALFHLAKLDGAIYLDEINTKKIGLHDLRVKISIIPQEPILFSASVRDNLDPFHKYEDADLWAALEEVELKDVVSSLDHLVNHGGSNFSAGQRQLVCLARAILRNNKVLVLDEATANVDPTTDGLIQTTIRRKFRSCTVLTIAHRLQTVMDSDKVLVMDHGVAVEYDHPHVLLQNENGQFTKMVRETGNVMAEELKKIAKQAYDEMPKESVATHTLNGSTKA